GRQGILLSISHPFISAKAIVKMFKAMASEKEYNAINSSILERSNAEQYRTAKLFIVDPNEYNIAKMEEAYMSSLAERIPGVAASARAYITFLNVLRAD